MRRPEDPCDSPVDEAANSIAPIGKYSLDIRPSHSTTASVLLVVMRKTTPRRAVQIALPPRLLLNAAAARAVSFTLSPCLINFSLSVTPNTAEARTVTTLWRGFVTSRQTFVHCGHNCRAVSSIVGGAEAGHPGHGIITRRRRLTAIASNIWGVIQFSPEQV